MQTREQGTVMRSTDSEWGSSRDRGTIITGAALIGVAGVAWVGVVLQGMSMKEGAGAYDLISLSGGFAFLAAWVVMMAAMMLPSATPMIALFDKVGRGSIQGRDRAVGTALFALVYLGI